MVVLRRDLVQVEELLAQRALLARRTGPVLVLDRDGKALPERFDRLVEIQALGLADKGDDVARLAAAEALVDPHVGVHVKRGRFLVVEGTKPLEARSGLFQGRDPRHHVHDVHATPEVADTGGFDHGHGVRPERRRAWLKIVPVLCSLYRSRT